MTLDEFCRQAPLTSDAMAEKLGVLGSNRARTIQRYRKGERIPDLPTIRRIEQVTGGKVSWTDWGSTAAEASAA